jgi:uncharacterized membrane protein SirB2
MDYVSLKIAHMSCVAISYTLFVVRGVWMIRNPALLQRPLRSGRHAGWFAVRLVAEQ